MDAHDDESEARERSSPSGKVVYKAIVREAQEELDRPASALFWSGLAAGLAMGLSTVAQGVLRHHLPEADWRPLVVKLGYAFGFLVVILGRQQLFTENTLTPMLPLLRHKDAHTFGRVMRLWGIVLAANLVGAVAVAAVLVHAPAFEASVKAEFLAIGHETMRHEFWTVVWRAVFAGWLIALLVWMLPYAESAHFFLIVAVTWLIGVGGFSHIVAGAVDASVLGWAGEKPWGTVATAFIVPTLIGNVVGGVLLVATLNHAQVTSGDGDA